jgi:ribosomal protein L37AE/L43A
MDLPNLPTMEEYFDRISRDTTTYIYWSEALFQCPFCKTGKVKRNETEILASNPLKSMYQCFDCGKVFYR